MRPMVYHVSFSPFPLVEANEKGAFGSPLTSVDQFDLILTIMRTIKIKRYDNHNYKKTLLKDNYEKALL